MRRGKIGVVDSLGHMFYVNVRQYLRYFLFVFMNFADMLLDICNICNLNFALAGGGGSGGASVTDSSSI
ncbi:Hypothetical predicted protein [Octopus vulgaris]|uniref:Uncharacterized protein n=1 Tax=Octopus vulgaris TaxID=6645 RepID=A0AA36AVR2_OCTVU|nr:Hypothetical predicted protein [Octopus vulgaris]